MQRQNEPSIAVSTRNPLHLVAGANDYRTVDLSVLTDHVLGDAWLGLFKSFNGGQTWRSTVLPGCTYSIPECATTPAGVLGFQGGSDPTVRAGTNGMFYYSGIAFNRGNNQPGAVFVARLIDDNNLELGDPIRYIGTVAVDRGNSGQFLDKPWLAVDIPRPGAGMCTIPGVTATSSSPGVPAQTFPAGNVYLAYSIFVGNDNNIRTKIMFTRSTDCGATWSNPTKLSEGYPVNQGVAVAVAPDGTIYLAWRQFKVLSGSNAVLNPDAILIAKSTDGGQTFTKATMVTEFTPFEQGTSGYSFRTSAFPTMAISPEPFSHRVYIAFAARVGPDMDGRIVLTSSTDGISWTAPTAINDPPPSEVYNPSARGHHMMPALSFAGGKLTLVYYDMREDHTVGELQCPSPPCTSTSQLTETRQPAGELVPPPGQQAQVFNTFLADALPTAFTTPMPLRRHTLDVRVAQANPGPSPTFVSTRVSQYPFGSPSDGLDFDTDPIRQLRFNPPNLPLFAQGTVPFFGDYIDIGAQPFSPVANPGWAYNTAPSNSTVFHAVWTDNRDVRPPVNGNWTNYTPLSLPQPGGPPISASCVPGQAGMRNQNIYTARISQGLIAAALQNSKQLGFIPNTSTLLQRLFTILVQNATNQNRSYRLTIVNQPQPSGVASFLQFSPSTTLDVSIARRSTVSRPVFVTSSNPDASVTVNVVEINMPGPSGTPVPGGLQATVVLNPDISNPDISNPDISNPDISNAEVYNPDISNPDITNPDISNPDITNPDISNPDISNPDISNPDISNGTLTDGQWQMTNKGNTSATYNVKLFTSNPPPAGVLLQLILHKVYTVPSAIGCTPAQSTQNILLSNIPNPVLTTDPSTLGTPDITNPDITNPTLTLAPGETANITVRAFFDGAVAPPGSTKADIISFLSNTLQPVVVSLAANTGTTTPPADAPVPIITTTSLPSGTFGFAYSATVQAIGGSGTRTWSISSGSLPPGLSLNSATGEISGTPGAVGTFNFTVQLVTSGPPAQSTTRSLSIVINPPPSFFLVFVTQPSSAHGSQLIAPAVKIKAQDASAAVIPGVNVTVALVSNPSSGTLSGTLTQTTDATGVATYSNLSVDRGGVGYTLAGSSGAFNTGPSTAFDIYGFSATGSMSVARTEAAAVRLADGRILVTGGYSGSSTAVATAEIWNPSTSTFTATGSMITGRAGHTATLLGNGKVLITGGATGFAVNGMASAELYDPGLGTFATVGPMTQARNEHTATLLGTGKVLIAGGWPGGGSQAEIFDPSVNTFTATTGAMAARGSHTATLLGNGKVLIAGGRPSPATGTPTNTAVLYDPATDTFAATAGTLVVARLQHAASLLGNGKVLISGGDNSASVFNSAELYDPVANTFASTAGSMATARTRLRSTLLASGKVLISAGFSGSGALTSCELFDPGSNTFSPTGSLSTGRHAHGAIRLLNDKVLMVDGTVASSELYHPAP